jgi:L-alanine-DL-glutamate epimerase-like enolase superfamily enzyme
LSRLDCFEVELPVRAQLYTMSQEPALTAFTTIVVRVEAEDGTAGFGESCTLGTNPAIDVALWDLGGSCSGSRLRYSWAARCSATTLRRTR